MVDKIANRYRISRLIGQGGMADVYLAYDEILGRDVAVKVLRQKMAEDPQTLFRFIREASAARRLDHPNVVEIYDVGESGDLHYIVMEYVPGQTLKNIISSTGPMDAKRAIEIMKKLTSAIAQAHERRIIHRDIKPQNVLVRRDGELKISDFGIAIAADDYDSLTRQNMIMGSAHYLAPETAAGLPADCRIDLYALGIVFFELLCGSVPFTGTSAAAIALKHLQDPLPHIQPFNPSVTQAIENVVIKATAKDPNERYQSAEELLYDLEHCTDPDRSKEKPLVLKTTSIDLPSAASASSSAGSSSSKTSTGSSTDSVHKSQSTHSHSASGQRRPLKAAPEKKHFTAKSTLSHAPEIRTFSWRVTLLSILAAILGIGLLFMAAMRIGVMPVDGWFGWHEVPSVIGMTQQDALTVLEQSGISGDQIEIRQIASDSYDAGQTQSTSIPAGSFIHDDETLTLTVVKGPTFLISDYTGLYLDDVRDLFAANGVTLPVEVSEQPTAGTNPGVILAQDGYAPGERIDPQTDVPIHFTVTAYPTVTIDQSWIGRDVNDVKQELNDQGIAVSLKNKYGTSQVTEIDPPIGSTYTQEGSDSVVTLYH